MLCLSFAQAALAVGPFELRWMNSEESGATYKSADHPNGIFVVEAYFLNCPYCHQNAPQVDALAEEYADNERVQVLDVGVDRKDADYESWISQHNPNHPVLNDGGRKLISQLGTSGYPSTYVIDCKGTVVYKTSGTWNSAKKDAIKKAIDGLGEETCEPESL